MIAMPTIVTMLIPDNRRDRANGLVGTVIRHQFPGHFRDQRTAGRCQRDARRTGARPRGLAGLRRPSECGIGAGTGGDTRPDGRNKVDVRGTLALVRGIPGALALIIFAAFNNFLGGAFIALLDAYGLSLMSVQAWGVLWGVLSSGFIIGGLLVARTGLSRNPVRIILLGNLVLWTVTCLFPRCGHRSD